MENYIIWEYDDCGVSSIHEVVHGYKQTVDARIRYLNRDAKSYFSAEVITIINLKN